jgi:protein TonB
MKPGIYLSRLVDDPVSKKRFLLALVIVIGLHLIFLTIWKLFPSAPDVKKKPELVIELGMPPASGAMGAGTASPAVVQESTAQKPTPTPKPTPSKTPAAPDASSKSTPLADEGKKPLESLTAPAASGASAAPQAPSLTASTPERPGPAEPSTKDSAVTDVTASPPVSPPAGGAKEPNEAARTAEADYKAAYLNNPRPAYPRLAHRMGIEGTVILQADVSEQGIPLQVRLFQSSGNDLLDQSALSTVAQWRFTPARKDGVITRSTVRIPITFSLKVQAKK